MGQTSSVMGSGTSTALSESGQGSSTNSQRQSSYNTNQSHAHYNTDHPAAPITSYGNASNNGKRNDNQTPFGPVFLINILNPTDATLLLGEVMTRRIIRAYRRVIISSISTSSGVHNNSHYNHSVNNQVNDFDSFSSDEYDQDESEEEACDIDDIMEIYFLPEVGENSNMSNISSSTNSPSQPTNNGTQSNWFSPRYGIDKVSFPKLILPHHANPPLGVMDCIFTALTTKLQEYPNNYSGANTSPTISAKIHLSDLLIFFAVFLHGKLELKAALAFHIYDSFQRQATITRDIINRFITAVYSNELAESALTKKILDNMFTVEITNKSSSGGYTTVNDLEKKMPQKAQIKATRKILKEMSISQFVKGISLTASIGNIQDTGEIKATKNDKLINGSPPQTGSPTSTMSKQVKTLNKHILIDWLEKLCRSMLPETSQIETRCLISSNNLYRSKPSSTSSPQKTNAAMNAYLKNLYREYKMTKVMQFECKRKFRSVCSICSTTNALSSLPSTPSSTTSVKGVSNEDDPVMGSETQIDANRDSENRVSQPQKYNNHVINIQSFCHVVADENHEMGWGGYLPKSLAQSVFYYGCQFFHRTQSANENIQPNRNNIYKQPKEEWDLSDAISFGCLLLREKSDETLMKFCFFIIRHMNKNENKSEAETNLIESNTTNYNSKAQQNSLDKNSVKKVLLSILDHAAYRQQRDSPINNKQSDNNKQWPVLWWYHRGGVPDENKDLKGTCYETNKPILVDSAAAKSLKLIPDNAEIHGNAVFLDALVDYVFETSGEENYVSFEGFKKWNAETSALHLIMLDMKLIAGVVFGVRPSAPVQEFALVEEIRRRFKLRYPASQSRRRGRDGTIWFILSTPWWKKWTEYSSPAMRQVHRDRNVQNVTQSGNMKSLPGRPVLTAPSSPGEIDNISLLVQGSLALRRNISFKTDFELIPPLVWQALQAWHDGGPPIYRTVTNTNSTGNTNGVAPNAAEIELYPFFVTIALADANTGQPRPFQQSVPVSKFKPLHILVDDLCKSLVSKRNEIGDNVRLWRVGNTEGGNEEVQLLDLNFSLRDQKVNQVQTDSNIAMLILELRNDEGEWPRGEISSNDDIEVEADGENVAEDSNTEIGDGIVGLHNMGNTCYLNSSIQCLSHTPLLRQYFTSKAYLKDINTTNIFGHQGRLARVSALLINQLWKPQAPLKARILSSSYNSPTAPIPCPSLTPKSFKDAIGKFNDHFSGNEQHDAQELLSYLLGGLSEDLNRIESKPYIEQPDSDGRPDKELADIWWKNHLLREMSIIVALFTGQYKSLLTCKACRYESARFEPFMYLQLPLPEDDLMTVSVILFPLDDSTRVLKYSVRTRHNGNVKDVLMELARIIYHEEVDNVIESNQDVTKKKDTRETNNASEKGEEVDTSEASFDDTEDDESDSTENEENRIISQMADNMAVAEVRDCHVRSITPPARHLSEIQSRDTGEIPLLFVYQLEPTKHGVAAPSNQYHTRKGIKSSEENSSNKKNEQPRNEEQINSTSSSVKSQGGDSHHTQITQEKASNSPPPKGRVDPDDKSGSTLPHTKAAYIAVAQRKLEPLPHPFLHSFYLRTFDTPLLLRLSELEGYTGKDLYELVARRISRFTPGHSITNLLKLTLKCGENIEIATEGDGEKKLNSVEQKNSRSVGDRRKNGEQTTIDMETVSAGPIPRFGFRLRITSRDCRRCALCPWFECCIGCVIPDDDYPTIVKDGDSVTLDWHIKVYDAFRKDKDGKKPDEKMDTNDYIKCQSQVLESVEKHSSCKQNNFGGGSISLEECLDAFAKEERIPEAYCSKCKDFRVSTKRMSLWRLPPVMIIHLKRFQFTQHMKRKLRNLVVFPIEGLDFSRIVASDNSKVDTEEEIDSSCNGTNEKIDAEYNGKAGDENSDNGTPNEAENDKKEDNSFEEQLSSTSDGRSESLYDLYGVVHHQGALSTGHYVASLRSETDGKWRLFNDAQVYELGSKEVVDATAYILFYVRRDVKAADLSDFWDTSSRVGEGLTEEQIDKLTKREKCNIS